MKKILLISLVLAVGFSQFGCLAWLSGKQNTVTEYNKDGNVVKVSKLSDDAVNYNANALARGTMKVDCAANKFTPEQCALVMGMSFMGQALSGWIPRGMNGFEMTDSIAKTTTPYGFGAFAVDRFTSRPTSVNQYGDGNQYTPFENHVTGSDSAATDIQYQSPTTTSSTSSTTQAP